MSELIGVALRRRRSRVEVERLVAEYQRSGQTRKVFCAEHGLSPATLDNYRKLRGSSAEPGESRILPVELVSSMTTTTHTTEETDCALWVELSNGRRIQVGRGFDGPTLERLVASLDKA